MKILARLAVPALLLAVGPSCGGDEPSGGAAKEVAVDPTLETCNLCAMVVREQLAPRAQVLHRDGTRVHLCSVSELAPYLAAPSPHGRPSVVWVETLDPDDGPAPSSADPRPWAEAAKVWFVVGGPARAVMGASILAYELPEQAEAIASACGGTVLDWDGLLQHLSREVSP